MNVYEQGQVVVEWMKEAMRPVTTLAMERGQGEMEPCVDEPALSTSEGGVGVEAKDMLIGHAGNVLLRL